MRRTWRNLMLSLALFLNLAHFLDHFFLLIFPTAVLAIHPVWDMSYGEALALGTPGFVAFAVATPLAGWLGDRFGARPMMTVFFFGIGVSSVLTGFAAGPVTLACGLAAIGVFASIYHPVGTAMVVRVATRRGRALGVNGVFGNMGVAAAALVTAWLTAQLGWRTAFILPGVLTCLLGVGFAVRREPEAAEEALPAKPAGKARPQADQIKVLLVVATSSLFGGMVFNGVTIALPKLFSERLHEGDLATVGSYASLVFALAAFTQIPVGRLLDRIGAKPIFVTVTLLQTVLLTVIAQTEGPLVVVTAIPLMLAIFGVVPVGAWLVSHYVAPEWRSRVFSVQFLLALGVSSAVVPLLSYTHEATGGFRLAFFLFAGATAIVCATASILLPTPKAMQARMAAARQAVEG
jgi:MFS family permease